MATDKYLQEGDQLEEERLEETYSDEELDDMIGNVYNLQKKFKTGIEKKNMELPDYMLNACAHPAGERKKFSYPI